METSKAQAIIEGLLFAAGDSVSLEKIANIIDMDKRKNGYYYGYGRYAKYGKYGYARKYGHSYGYGKHEE